MSKDMFGEANTGHRLVQAQHHILPTCAIGKHEQVPSKRPSWHDYDHRLALWCIRIVATLELTAIEDRKDCRSHESVRRTAASD